MADALQEEREDYVKYQLSVIMVDIWIRGCTGTDAFVQQDTTEFLAMITIAFGETETDFRLIVTAGRMQLGPDVMCPFIATTEVV